MVARSILFSGSVSLVSLILIANIPLITALFIGFDGFTFAATLYFGLIGGTVGPICGVIVAIRYYQRAADDSTKAPTK